MAIAIYTYSNPYKINKEPYWASIQNCFHLCASQTLVNGLCDQYHEFYSGKLTTITNFINVLYENWESDSTSISQRAAIDNAIEYLDFSTIVESNIDAHDVLNSLKRNRSYVLESIRTMFELGMEPGNIKEAELTYDQRCVVELYRELKRASNKCFELRESFSEEEIDSAITYTISQKVCLEKIEEIRKDSIIVHGIHQFSPIMLRLIEEISNYKLVIILFNYQPDYKSVYQTWFDVYSSFESKILISPKNLNNDTQSFEGGKIADSMAALIGGNTSAIDFNNKIRITEFNNSTEFAGYIALRFEKAEEAQKNDGFAHPTLFYMDEQVYAANSNVNEILKIYFPEQFGERDFLDYPIGHFFLSITNMWDSDDETLCIKDIQDIHECLSCGIISESEHGELITIFERSKMFFSAEVTITGIINKLKRLKKRIREVSEDDEDREEWLSIEYFDLSDDEINQLIKALNDLNEITRYFYEDFNNKKNDFKKFYKKIGEVLVSQVLDAQDINDEFKDVVQRVLVRLDEVKEVEVNVSIDCLKETMKLYLQQIPSEGKGGNWIVRNFEQIDGDILRKNAGKKSYHFACLSDRDMSITHKDEFSWPLNINFFEIAQAPVDWKYQVFVTSRLEYKNYRRYALFHGLVYSKSKIELSYVKNEDDSETALYYILSILNADIKPYEPNSNDSYRRRIDYIKIEDANLSEFSQYDLMKYRLCTYRFLMESIIEGRTVYKDEFLLKKYLTVVLEHRVRKHFSGKAFIRTIVFEYLTDQMDELKEIFSFINQTECMDIKKSAIEYIEKYAVKYGKFTVIKEKELEHMIKREIFLTTKFNSTVDPERIAVFKNSTQAEVDATLSKEKLRHVKYEKTLNGLCSNCSEKDICLEMFRFKKNKGDL